MKPQFHTVVFIICLICAVSLIVGGFFVPPIGIIDGSVLTAVGELFGFATLAMLPSMIASRRVHLQHGKTNLILDDPDEK